MYPSLDHFAKAYQGELLRTNANGHGPRRTLPGASPLWDQFLITLGDALIALGEKVKGKTACPELSRGQA